MTHILISKIEIENNIKILNQCLTVAVNTNDIELETLLRTQIEHTKNIFKLGKQISLNEKDIEEKAIQNSRGYDAQSVAITCYKKALLDLLNDKL